MTSKMLVSHHCCNFGGLTPTAECVSSLELPPQLFATYVLVEGIKTRVTERESWPTNRAFLEPVVLEGLSGLPPLESCHNSIHKSS
jgi:hypothetical protein